MDIQYRFVTPLVFFKNTELLNDLKKYIYKQNVKGIESNCAPHLKKNLVESDFDLFSKNDIVIEKTKNFIGNSITELINCLHREDSTYNINFIDSWFHIGKTNSLHEPHIHGNCSWCGVYYVDIGDEGSGETTFKNPVYSTYSDDGSRWHFAGELSRVQPENGLLVLFPSYLSHYQSIYTGEKDRIVVAFNAQIFIHKWS